VIASGVPADAAPDVSATISADGRTATLFAVNASTAPVDRPIDLSAFGDGARELSAWTLADREKAGQPDVSNGFSNPQRVGVAKSKIQMDSNRLNYRFPPLSLTVFQWTVTR
jgi:alpha-L-arabinofuranosidase